MATNENKKIERTTIEITKETQHRLKVLCVGKQWTYDHGINILIDHFRE